jgi:hypothetical protein
MEKMLEALNKALEDMSLLDKDKAVVDLARLYARAIDSMPITELEKFGPKYLAVLESLGMTPKARAALVKGKDNDSDSNKSPLDELRARRNQRERNAPSLDPSA